MGWLCENKQTGESEALTDLQVVAVLRELFNNPAEIFHRMKADGFPVETKFAVYRWAT